MGWLRLVSFKIEILGLFCKTAYKRDYILQKRRIILKSLLIIATPWSIRAIALANLVCATRGCPPSVPSRICAVRKGRRVSLCVRRLGCMFACVG